MRTLSVVGPEGEALFQSGLALGAEPVDAPLWTGGMNVEFQEGEVQQSPGWELLAPTSEKILAITQSDTEVENRAYYASKTSVRYFNGDQSYILGLGYNATEWQLVPWGTWLLASDGVNKPKLWKNVDQLAEISTTTFNWAKLFTKWGPYVIALNTSNGGTWVEWCTADDIETWEVLASNSAGNYTIRDLDTEIVATGRLGQNISIYSQNQQTIMSYAGGNYIFAFAPGLKGIGAVGPDVVQSVKGMDYGISNAGFWATDGYDFKYLDQGDTNKWFRKHVNLAAARTIRSGQGKNKIFWALPIDGATEPNIMIAFNYSTNAFSLYNYVPSAFAEKSVFQAPLAGLGTKLVKLETGKMFGTKGIDSFVQTKPLDCGDNTVFKRLQKLLLTLQGDATFSLGVQDNLEDPITWFHSATAQTVNDFLDREGVYVSMKFSGLGNGTDWAMSGFKLLGEPTSYAI